MNNSNEENLKVPILVWDWPVRVFHWSLALCIFISFFTGESERYSLLHQTLGYAAAGLLGFRLVWGFSGTRYARFSQFVRGPRAVLAYLKSIRQGIPSHDVGHNPVGAWAVVILMLLVAATSLTGWMIASVDAPGWQEDLHEMIANTLMVVVVIHVIGVIFSSRLHQENLVKAMLTGFKKGYPADGISSNWWWLAVLLILALTGFIFNEFQV